MNTIKKLCKKFLKKFEKLKVILKRIELPANPLNSNVKRGWSKIQGQDDIIKYFRKMIVDYCPLLL
jgi:hypothetical protein